MIKPRIPETNHGIQGEFNVERLSSLSTVSRSPDVPLPILAHSVSGLLLILLKWWLDKGLLYPPERMDEIFQRLVMGSLRDVLGYDSPTAL